MSTRPVRRLGYVAAVGLLLAGCGVREHATESSGVEPIAWEACGDIECAAINVPVDHFAPEFSASSRIKLRVYRQVSPADGSRHVPLLIHPGGPGADVRAAVNGARAALAPIIDDFDIYALSTRGTVDGVAFDCGKSLNGLREIDDDSGAAERFARDCVATSPSLIGRVGTLQSVEDLEDFRQALGFDSVRFLGWSYGATLGVAWAFTHPESIRSMVLDAPSDPRLPWPKELVARYVAAADAFARGPISTSLDTAGNARESALAREYLLYEPGAKSSANELAALRLGETPDGNNDGGIEAQIGVHCSDVTHEEARSAIAVTEPMPRIGFGATFDRVCLELAEAATPLSRIDVDQRARRLDVLVVSTSGDHVIASSISQRLAKDMRWRGFVVDADRHLSVGFDPVATKKAMAFFDSGE